uniref:UBA domain-containing protein n=1 Tax=Chromera velia CCMP2878 TaxID=1169474 RepID=A0A0G4FMF3_9ALVE|eukprot:Cvel_17779.t1-p1 / transcript=Cvel_17779.t1 / gene=Cvel_17779 / organism=Chromera_velia_CCMP2878 / gene_product=hypothetical protein / transcript_product=hypothetical protein / location=Cvel_scaffold1437:38802-39719(-) / protein_length=306 / sequence_SO=supercontig / SO=protein_coding / is_pseudo=false
MGERKNGLLGPWGVISPPYRIRLYSRSAWGGGWGGEREWGNGYYRKKKKKGKGRTSDMEMEDVDRQARPRAWDRDIEAEGERAEGRKKKRGKGGAGDVVMEDAEQARPRARDRDIEAERERAKGGKKKREEEEERRVQRKEEQRESDIDIIMRQTGMEREAARQALAEGGDLVKAILSLMNEQTETQQMQRGPPRGRQQRGEGKGWDIFSGDFGESAAAGKEASSVPVTPLEKQQQQPVSLAPLSPHPTTSVTVPLQPPTVVRLPSPSKTNSRTVPPTAVLRERLKAALRSIIPPIKGSKREGGLT